MRRSRTLLALTPFVLALTLVGTGNAIALAAAPSGVTPGGPIPDGFRAQSISWISSQHGWMLGSAPCGPDECTTVVGTTDGGGTWNTLGTIDAPLTIEDGNGVTEVRFSDDLHGYAFEPGMWATSDGGVTWSRQTQPGDGQLVMALSANADAVYAVVSPCRLFRECDQPSTMWRTRPGRRTWTSVPVALPVITGFGIVDLAQYGTVAYLVVPSALLDAPTADVLEVTLDGVSWSSRPDPCHPDEGETLESVAPITSTRVALLCNANIGFGKAAKRVVRSDDNGLTTRSAGMLPLLGIVSQMAAAPNGTLIVSSFSIGSWIYRNDGGKTWTTSVDSADGGEGWNDVVMTTNQIGWVIHGPASSPFLAGELGTTSDGGVTWAPV